MDKVPGYKFEIGKGVQVREGNDVAIIATGIMVQASMTAAEILAAEGINARVINIHTIKPLDAEIILKAARECGVIVTTEEHNIMAGFGSAVAELVAENCPVPVVRHGVNDEFGRSGAPQKVLDLYGLNAEGVVKAVRKALALKK